MPIRAPAHACPTPRYKKNNNYNHYRLGSLNAAMSCLLPASAGMVWE